MRHLDSFTIFAIGALSIAVASPTLAAFPTTLAIDGKLSPENRDTGGGVDPLANMRISVEDAGGAPILVEDHCGVTTVGRDGEFHLCLGDSRPVDVPFDGQMSVRVQACYDRAGCDGVTDPGTCRPRDYVEVIIPLCPTAFAHQARNADLLDGLDSSVLLQELSFTHPNLSISDGNTVSLASLANASVVYDNAMRSLAITDGSGTLVADLSPLAQTISRSGTDVTLSNGGGTFSIADNDNDPANELQTISRSGLNLTLSNGGGTVSLADNDNDPANELQQLSVAGSTLSISGGNTVAIPGDNLGSHVASTNLDMNHFDVRNARFGEYGDIFRFSNHGLSSRIAASNAAIDVAIFGSNEGTSGFEAGVYGRTQSPAGWGVFAEGRLGTSSTLVIGSIPSAVDSDLLTTDGSGNVRRRPISSLPAPPVTAGYNMGTVDGLIPPFSLTTQNWTCAGACTGGGAVQVTDGTDVDFYMVSNGLPANAIQFWKTQVTNQGLDAEVYKFSVTAVAP